MVKNLIILVLLFCSFSTFLMKAQTGSEYKEYDFENSTQGWEYSTRADESAIDSVYATTDEYYHGQYALAMNTHLDWSDSTLQKGVVTVMYPGDLENRPIKVWVKVPSGAQGDPQHPNAVYIFVKDQNFNSQISNYNNIGSTIPENTWTEIQFTPGFNCTTCSYTDAGFDPTKIQIVGVKIATGNSSQNPFQGTCYIDFVRLSRDSLIVPVSDHIFDFNILTPDQQSQKIYGYGPYWDVDPGWGAKAWDSNDITAQDSMVKISASFAITGHDSTRKGFIHTELQPNLDISNKNNLLIRAEIKFDPYVGPEKMLASIFIFDRQDAGHTCLGNDCNWFKSINAKVGGSDWNEIVFDLRDSTNLDTCANCVTQITNISLKNMLYIGIQVYSNVDYTGTIFIDNITIGGKEDTANFNNLNQGFVKRNNTGFELNGSPYRFAGNNNYYPF